MKKTTKAAETAINNEVLETKAATEIAETTENVAPEIAPEKKPAKAKKKAPAKKAPTKKAKEPEAEAKEPESATAEKSTAKKKNSRTPIISVDRKRTVKTDEDALKDSILDVVESMKSGKILTDKILGVENIGSKKVAVLYHGNLKIIIPSELLIAEMSVQKGSDEYENALAHSTIKHLGAEVDYIVERFDAEANVAIANRVRAMKARQRQYYLGFDRQGNKIVYPDAYCEGRVVSVLRNGVFVELFGIEVFIRLNELSYQRVINPENDFVAGQKVLVKILDIDSSDKDNIRVSASIKQARENPAAKALEKYVEGNYYMGTVTMIDEYGVFVSLDGGVDCLCKFPFYERPVRGARATVHIAGIDREHNKVWGTISHISNVF